MPIKVSANLQLNSEFISKEDIQELMETYSDFTGKRKSTGWFFRRHKKEEDTVSAWYSLNEIISFLTVNGVDLSNPDSFKDLGVRIYFGMHHKKHRFQPKPRSVDKEEYYFKDTPILVLTKKVDGKDEDQLKDNAFVSIAPFFDQGMDNARLCPPECNGGM